MKMITLILLLAFAFLLQISLASAFIGQSIWDKTLLNLRFDNSFNDSSNYNATNGFSFTVSSPAPVFNTKSRLGNASIYMSNDAVLRYSGQHLNGFRNFTTWCWVNISTNSMVGATDYLWGRGEVNALTVGEWAVIYNSAGTISFSFTTDIDTNLNTKAIAFNPLGNFELVTVATNYTNTSANGFNVYMFINNTLVSNVSGVLPTLPQTSVDFSIGDAPAGGRATTSGYDSCNFVNSSLTSNNITKIFNSGFGEVNEPANATIPISNSSPVVTLNFPNSNTTHNNTIPFNFTISDVEKDNITYAIYADTNLNPTTKINETNVTQGNFTFIYTFNTQVVGSINGTYYWKVNGTDNASNIFASNVLTFNITNNLNLYNVTNVSITPLPLSANTQAKCHFNITNKAGQKDNITKSDLKWFLNRTLLVDGNNNTLLNAPNVSLNANISCQVRVQTYLGETGWTEYLNSSYVVVGDTTLPNITNMSVSKSSYTSSETVNITAIVIDDNIVSSVKVTINDSTGNRTMSLLSKDIYQFASTFGIGSYNITYFIAEDGSGNRKTNNSNSSLNFLITEVASGGGGGGGGGGLQVVISNITNVTITELTCNKNGICNDLQQGEDFINCPSDCKFSVKGITCDDPTIPCIFKNAFVAKLVLFALPISFIFIILPPETRRRLKKQIFGG